MWAASAVSAAVGVLVFLHSFYATFTWDDRAAVLWNADVDSTTPLWPIFEHDFWGQNIGHASSHKSFRPVTVLSFRFTHWLSGYSPFAFHAGNVFMHAVACALVPWLASTAGLRFRGALAAGVLFAVHPVHCDSVSSIVGRADVVSAVFVLPALLAYAGSVRAWRSSSSWPAAQAVALFLLAHLFATLGAFSKEVGFTVWPLFTMLDVGPWLLDQPRPRSSEKQEKEEKGGGGEEEQGLGWMLGGLTTRGGELLRGVVGRGVVSYAWLAAVLVYRVGRHRGAAMYQWTIMENQIAMMPAGVSRALTVCFTHAWYASLLAWPRDLAFDHGFHAYEMISGWSDPRNLYAAVTYLAVAALVVFSVYHRRPVLLLGLGVLLATFVPASNALFFVGTEVAERLLYLPSVGFVIALVDLLDILLSPSPTSPEVQRQHQQHQQQSPPPRTSRQGAGVSTSQEVRGGLWGALGVWGVVVACVAVWWSVGTVLRDREWRDEVALFEAGVRVHPLNIKALNNLGLKLMNRNENNGTDVARAVGVLARAIRQYPHQPAAWHNLGLALRKQDRDAEALAALWRAAAVDAEPTCAVYHDLARFYVNFAVEDRVATVPEWAARAGGSVAQRYILWNVVRVPKDAARHPLLKPEGAVRLVNLTEMARIAAAPQPADADLPIFFSLDEPLSRAELEAVRSVHPVRIAKRLLERATGCGVRSADIWRDRGTVILEQGVCDGAQVEFQRCIDAAGGWEQDPLAPVHPAYEDCVGLLGVAAQACGNDQRAASAFQHVLARPSSSFRALSNAGNYFSNAGDHARAIQAHARALSVPEGLHNPAIHYNYLRALQRAGQLDAMRNQLAASQSMFPNHPYFQTM